MVSKLKLHTVEEKEKSSKQSEKKISKKRKVLTLKKPQMILNNSKLIILIVWIEMEPFFRFCCTVCLSIVVSILKMLQLPKIQLESLRERATCFGIIFFSQKL